MKRRRLLPNIAFVAAVLGGLSIASPAKAQLSMDYTLDATDPFNSALLSLGAGEYSVGVTGGAWNPWGFSGECDGDGACSRGWLTTFSWALTDASGGGGDPAKAGKNGIWANAPLATANAGDPFVLSLSAPSYLLLTLADRNYGDNLGSMTISVTEVGDAGAAAVAPEPGTVILLGTGLLGLGVVGIRRRKEDDHTV
ncbi:MAG: PEP-CTERM sorting domain-containing protein [Gemmatimonadota bacterium]|jgi:hypothetical protein